MVTTTVYQDGTSTGPRMVTNHFDGAGNPAGSAGPITPSAGTAPLCPSSATLRCNSVKVIDQDGRAAKLTDAYGMVTTYLYDLAGRIVREVRNDVVSPTDLTTQDIRAVSVYDGAGRPIALIDPLGRTTTKAYDALDRLTVVTSPNSSTVETKYTVAHGWPWRPARPRSGPPGPILCGPPTAMTAPVERWPAWPTSTRRARPSTSSTRSRTGPRTVGRRPTPCPSSSVARRCRTSTAVCLMHTGAHGANINVGTTTNVGTAWALAGDFLPGYTYRARIWSRLGTGAASVKLYLGQTNTATMFGASSTTALTGAWQVIDATWTVPGSTALTSVYLALRTETTTAADIRIDDAVVWDVANPARNIPSLTAYDADGEVVASILPGGNPGDDPLVTTTAYDAMGRPTDVVINAVKSGATTAAQNLTTSSTYDELGRQTSRTDPSVDGTAARVLTTYKVDRLGRTTSTIANDIATVLLTSTDDVTTTFAYNDRGELMASCAPQRVLVAGDNCATPGSGSAGAWRYTYDANGSVLTETSPTRSIATAMAVRTNAYDTTSGGARLTSGTDSNGTYVRHTDPTYDPLGRVTQTITYQNAGTGTPKLRTIHAYDAGSQRTNVQYSERSGSSWPITDELAFTYDARGRLATLTRTSVTPNLVITAATYNPDDTVATRTDVAGTLGTSNFGYDRLGRLISATSPVFSGTATYGWRNDSLPASRSWPASGGALTGAFGYDAAKRPTTLAVTRNSATVASFSRAFDGRGSVTTETQSLTGISGLAGSGTVTYGHDPIGRITTATGLGAANDRSYTYDASSNRLTEVEGSVTTLYTYDRTDELKTRKVGADAARTVTYDAVGNVTSLPIEAGGGTAPAYTYDLADHLLTMDGPTEPVITFGIDALGRSRTRQVGTGTAETLHYLGTSDAVVRIGGGSTPVDGALDPAGTRLATRQSAGAPSFLVPDPHGNVAGLWSNTGAAFVDAFRYDPWGESLAASPASGARTPWRYQGRLVEGEPSDAESYDFGFRSYLPDTATFGSLDDVAGSALDVRSLNRFVYAAGDPVTLIDPDGHRVLEGDDQREKMTKTVAKHQRKAAVKTQQANKANGWHTYRKTKVNVTKPKPPMTLTKADTWGDEFPPYSPEGTGGFDLGGFVHGALDIGGFIPVFGAIPDLVNAGIYAAEGDSAWPPCRPPRPCPWSAMPRGSASSSSSTATTSSARWPRSPMSGTRRSRLPEPRCG